MKENIVIASFSVESEAYQAITEIRANPLTEHYAVLQGQVLKNENGRLEEKDGFSTDITTGDDTFAGGMIGSLVGILGGPLGMLLSGSMGALIGAGVDAGDAESEAALLEKAGEKINKGDTAILLLVQEDSEDELNKEFSKFQSTVTRLDAAEVSAEIEHAKEVEEQMAKEARDKLRAQKSEAFKENVSKKRDALKEKFSKFVNGKKQ